MVDKTSKLAEEEYHFTEAETGRSYGEGNGGRGLFGLFKRRNVIVVIAVIVVAVVVYKMLGLFFAVRHKPVVAPIAPQVMELVKPPVKTEPSTVISSPDRISTLETSSKVTVAKLSQIDSELSQLQTTMNTLNTSVGSVNQSLEELSKAIQQQTQLLKTLKAPATPKIIKKVYPRQTYYIKAMIPGRAWLTKGPGGHSITVSTGSTIPGYGTVNQIDPQSGTVTTSTGAVIRYSPDEQ